MDAAIWNADMATTIDPFGGDLSLGPQPADGDPQMSAGYLLTLLRTDKGMHIDVLATVSAVLLGFLALLGSRRRRSSGKVFLGLMWAAYTVSYSVVSYTIGLIQSFEGPNPADSYLLWAVGLLLLLGSADAISAFSRHDVEQSKGMQAQHVLQAVLVLWLLLSRSSFSYGRWMLALFFLLCWVYSIFKMTQRTKALRMASSAHGLMRSAKVVADYMRANVDAATSVSVEDDDDDDDNPEDMMAGYRYLVLGEEEHSSPPSEPHYLTQVLLPAVDGEDDGGGKVVTIDMIWKNDGELLSSGDERARALKDTCLSFALFKLLKRRFCGLEIAEAGHPKTRDLVLKCLLAGGDHEAYERTFRVVEVELSFLYDFFYTKYPALFPTSRVLGVVRLLFLLGFLKMLRDFVKSAIWGAQHAGMVSPYYTFTTFNDLLFVTMIMAIDIMQQVATGYSNWAVVHFVCDYVRMNKKKKKPCCWTNLCKYRGIHQALIKLVAAHRARKPKHWDHKLGQYSLLRSFDYRPYITNAISRLTLRLLEPTSQGRRREPDMQLPAQVKAAVLSSLKESHGRLTNGLSAVSRTTSKERDGDLLWACTLPTHAHTVLVWHIATTLCDVEDTDAMAAATDDHRLVATSLSRYCAYLLAFVPEMLPDHSYVARQILDAVVREAQQHLGGTKDMPQRCTEMIRLGAAAASGRVQDTSILKLGARLGSQLVDVDKERRWRLLAEFWAELVLFLAPSDDNANVHADSLARGGEFITHLWALLTNAGILDRGTPAPNV